MTMLPDLPADASYEDVVKAMMAWGWSRAKAVGYIAGLREATKPGVV